MTTHPRAAASIEAILHASRRVIAERGPEKLKMSAVAEAAGVSRPTLYKWFPTRDHLLAAITAREEHLFDACLTEAVGAQRSPTRKLDAALRLLVTYLDDQLGPDPIGADITFAVHSLARSLDTRAESFARILGDALEIVPTVHQRRLNRHQAAEMFLRVAYSHYLLPHADSEELLANLRAFAGLPRRSMTAAARGPEGSLGPMD